MALCGMRGSLCRDALRNLARRLSCGLYSLCRGTSTGGSTGGGRTDALDPRLGVPKYRVDAGCCGLSTRATTCPSFCVLLLALSKMVPSLLQKGAWQSS